MAKRKIQIVDDERPTREAMARVLSDKYECMQAADAEQVMKTLESTPDLALMISDVRMPGEDGVSLVKRGFDVVSKAYASYADPTTGATVSVPEQVDIIQVYPSYEFALLNLNMPS
jgi:DNA-binding LytR/AlgR family response regulator